MGGRYIWGGCSRKGSDCCLSADTRVAVPGGARRIDELRAGDAVWSWVDGRIEQHAVTAAWESRTQPVFEVRMRGRTIVASGNHPFLVVRRVQPAHPPTSPARWEPSWVTVDDLSKDDLVVTAEEYPDLGGAFVPLDLAWLLGLWIGDGSLHRKGATFCVFGDVRDRTAGIIRTHFGGAGGSFNPSSGLSVSNVALRRWLIEQGADPTWRSHTKRVPEAVWTWDRKSQQAFLDGYAEADGSAPRQPVRHGDRTYASTSADLIADVRALHIDSGHSVARISTNERHKPVTIKGKAVREARPLYTFGVRLHGRYNGAALTRNVGLRPFVRDGLTLRRIQSVTPIGVQRTWDIEVEGAHSFFADGVVVHNSGFMSILLNSVQGQSNVFVRRFATGNIRDLAAGLGLRPNLGDANDFNLGVMFSFESRSGVGHVAGSLGSLKVESRGGRGVLVGAAARGATNGLFRHHFHLPIDGVRQGAPPPQPKSLLLQPYPGHLHRRSRTIDGHNRLIQQRLNQLTRGRGHTALSGRMLGVDGEFGPQTERVIRSFQHTGNLEVDGVVGPRTWTRIFRR